MSNNKSTKKVISGVFFFSQLTALTLFGLASAYGNFEADEGITGVILVTFDILLIIIAVLFSALPNKLASTTSFQGIIIIAISVSIFTLMLSYFNASTYFELPSDFQRFQGVRNLRMAAFVGLGAFGLAFLVNLISILSNRQKAVSE